MRNCAPPRNASALSINSSASPRRAGKNRPERLPFWRRQLSFDKARPAQPSDLQVAIQLILRQSDGPIQIRSSRQTTARGESDDWSPPEGGPRFWKPYQTLFHTQPVLCRPSGALFLLPWRL